MRFITFLLLFQFIVPSQHLMAQNFTMDTVINRQVQLYSSPYKSAIGVKMYPGALSYKHFTKNNKAIEAIGYVTLDGFSLSLLKEFHNLSY